MIFRGSLKSLYIAIAVVCSGYGTAAHAWDLIGIDYSGDPAIGNRIWGIDSESNTKELLTTKVFDGNSYSSGRSYADTNTGKLVINAGTGAHHIYDWVNDTWEDRGASSAEYGMVIYQKPKAIDPADITTNASAISSNDTDISTNASAISSNDTDIASNASSITTNASAISSNDTDISTNASAISSNDTDIASNASSIRTNASAISSNDTDISTNASAISSNDTDISNNASAISSNDDDISSLQSLVKSSGSEVQIGSDSDGVTISSSAVKVGGENMIRKESDGSVYIGKLTCFKRVRWSSASVKNGCQW